MDEKGSWLESSTTPVAVLGDRKNWIEFQPLALYVLGRFLYWMTPESEDLPIIVYTICLSVGRIAFFVCIKYAVDSA